MFGGDEYVHYLDCSDFFPWECTFVKIYLIVPFKHEQLIVRSLYLKVNTSMSKY